MWKRSTVSGRLRTSRRIFRRGVIHRGGTSRRNLNCRVGPAHRSLQIRGRTYSQSMAIIKCRMMVEQNMGTLEGREGEEECHQMMEQIMGTLEGREGEEGCHQMMGEIMGTLEGREGEGECHQCTSTNSTCSPQGLSTPPLEAPLLRARTDNTTRQFRLGIMKRARDDNTTRQFRLGIMKRARTDNTNTRMGEKRGQASPAANTQSGPPPGMWTTQAMRVDRAYSGHQIFRREGTRSQPRCSRPARVHVP